MEKRLLLAFVLSAAILVAWSLIFPPPEPQPEIRPPASADTVSPGTPADEEEVVSAPDTAVETEEEPPIPAAAITGEVEQKTVLANSEIEVELTNRGAAVTSYRLLRYEGDEGEAVDLVQKVPLPDAILPLQLVRESGGDEALYEISRDERWVVFRWADGKGSAVTKRVALSGDGFGLDVELEVAGDRRGEAMAIGTGMRNLGDAERNSRLALWGEGIVLADGEVARFKRRKVKAAMEVNPQTLSYAGFEDAYFLSLLRPEDGGISSVRIEPFEFVLDEEKEKMTKVLRVSVVPTGATLHAQLLGAPKEYKLLQEIDQGVERTLDFGFFSPISVVFLKALHWIYGVVGNYGVAIILLTVGIRILLFPLMHTSTVSMRKMQKVQPKVKEIQARYKKKKTDPQARNKMNQEVMALYKQEGVNPMAGCLPMILQLPILFALYKLFLQAIELRHAPFMLWIGDLSAKDPYFVTPVLMTATMWLQQRLAPQAGDPQQQRLMRMMPLIFGIMFLQFPSGLVLYWLTNNVISIIQQEVTLHIVGERQLGGRSKRKGAKK